MKTMQTKHFRSKTIRTMFVVFILIALSLFGKAIAQTPVHAWTFEDGTARDTSGNAHGALQGGASVKRGNLVLNQGQFVELPAYIVEINQFSEVSVETWFTSSGNNANYHMLWYFGNSTPDPMLEGEFLGSDGYFLSPARADDLSRTAISTGNTAMPWLAETGVNGSELEEPGMLHHVVSVINDTAIFMYIDGQLTGYSLFSGSANIDQLSNMYAWLGKGGYTQDPTWTGWIHSVNIYDESLGGDEVEALYAAFPEPHNLSVGDISTTSAVLGWSQLDSADTWDIAYGSPGFDPESEGTLVEGITERSYHLTGLQSSSLYEIYVRANSGEGSSNWSIPDTFATECEPAELPLTVNFDNSDNLPLCWGQQGTGNYYATDMVTWFSNSSPNSVFLEHGDQSHIILMAPDINEAIANVTIQFAALHEAENNFLEVGVVADTDDPTSFTVVDTVILTTDYSWHQYSVYLDEYSGTEGRIAFRYGSYDFIWGYLLIDDVVIKEIPACPEPYNLSVTGTTTTSVDIAWSQARSPDSWNIEWGPEGFSKGNGSLFTGFNGISTTISGLSPGTAYAFYVQADCGEDGDSPWAGPFNFNTQFCSEEVQCVYEFELIDNFGDGWNGATMDIIQDGVVVRTIGEDFLTGDSLIMEIGLCTDMDFEVFWANGGDFFEEVGLKITGPSNEELYNDSIIGDKVGITLYQGMVGCGLTTSAEIIAQPDNWQVYPNPFSSHLNIRHAEGVNRVVITSLTGQKVMDIRLDASTQQTIHTGQLSNGIYIVVIYADDNQQKMFKMVKE